MKKLGTICSILVMFIVIYPSVNASTITVSYPSCDNVTHVDTSFDGGRLAYGCSTYAVDEVFSTYSKDTSTEYRGKVQTHNESWKYGPYANGLVKSEASDGYVPGSQTFGND